jgi:hypothetical protein
MDGSWDGPSDVEPNGGPCIDPRDSRREYIAEGRIEAEIVRKNAELMAVPPVERAVIVLDEYRSSNNNDGKLARLRKQLAALEAIEREHDRKIKVMNDIVDCRDKIKALGEIPCA